ncbi:MAG: S26 family signal peptidase, partial [Planctomycetota bacterium]
VQPNSPFAGFNDYTAGLRVSTILPNADDRSGVFGMRSALETVFTRPDLWDRTDLFASRSSREFTLQEKQYFPLGDNSAQSSDARASEWVGHRYVEEKYLLGKALLVFWPHTWNSPVPFTPNVKRMGFIR